MRTKATLGVLRHTAADDRISVACAAVGGPWLTGCLNMGIQSTAIENEVLFVLQKHRRSLSTVFIL